MSHGRSGHSKKDVPKRMPLAPIEKKSFQSRQNIIAQDPEQKTHSLMGVQASTLKVIEKMKSSSLYQRGASQNKAYEVKKELNQDKLQSPRNQKIWVAKSSPSTLVACCEVVGQEALRLLNPDQKIKTRFFSDGENLGVISEKKIDFEPLDENYSDGYFAGLATTTLLSLLFHETDLKLDHIDAVSGVKIDGDYMLSGLHNKSLAVNSAITVGEIKSLPYVDRYHANQWLDQIKDGKKQKNSDLILGGVSEDPRFQQELNEVMLRVLLVSDALWERFVKSYVADNTIGHSIVDFIKKRCLALQNAALEYLPFRDYVLQKNDSEGELKNFQTYVRDFITSQKNHLIPEKDYPAFKASLSLRLAGLRTYCKQKAISAEKFEEEKTAEPSKPKTPLRF